MKIITILSIVVLMILSISACSSTTGGDNTTSTGRTGSTSDDAANPGSQQVMQLMMGTVLLEETEYAVDADQAADLLPMWKVLNSLSASEISAQAEIDATIESIRDAMTPEQIAAIEGMEISMSDTTQVMQTLGIEFDNGERFGEMDPEMQATMEAMRESGERPPEGFGPGQGFGGGMGPGGQGFGGDAGMNPELMETAIAERGGSLGRGFGINTQLLEALILFLEAKVQ